MTARNTALRLAFIATACLTVAATLAVWRLWPQIWIHDLARLCSRLDERPLHGRLVDFPYGREPSVLKSADSSSSSFIRFRAKAANLCIRFADASSAKDLHAYGVFLLAAGSRARAVVALSRAASMAPGRADYWNDLAVGRLASFIEDHDAPQLIDGLGDADRALQIQPKLEAAALNRAEILEMMGLDVAAANAWADYCILDRASEWSREAQRHRQRLAKATLVQQWTSALDELRRLAAQKDSIGVRRIVAAFPQDARANADTIFLREWATAVRSGDDDVAAAALNLIAMIGEQLANVNGESLPRDVVLAIRTCHDRAALRRLAEAAVRYVSAREAYGDAHRDVGAAARLFQSAADDFRRVNNPMANVADFYFSCALYDSSQYDEALKLLRDLEGRVPASHAALHAFIQWEIGSVQSRQGLLYESLQAYLCAARLFEGLGENSNANVVEGMAAGMQSIFGRRFESCQIQIETFHRLSRSGDVTDLQHTIDFAARTEALSGHWMNVFSLMTLAIDPGLRVNPRVYVSGLIWHALAAHRVGFAGVEQDLSRARQVAAAMSDAAIRKRAENDIVFAEAVTLRAGQPLQSIPLFNRYLDQARQMRSVSLFVAEALLERGRAFRHIGNYDAAEHDFRGSLELAHASGNSMPTVQFRDAYFQTADSSARELVQLLVRRGRNTEAFRIIDDEHSRAYGRSIPASLSKGGPKEVIVAYESLPDYLLIFLVDIHGVHVKQVSVTDVEIEAAVDRFCNRPDQREKAAELSQILLKPVASELARVQRVVFVADRNIARVPFAALPFPGTKQRLLDVAEVVIAPSAASYSQLHAPWTTPHSLAAIGNPAFDRERFPELPFLAGAEDEVRRIAKMYDRATTLTGGAATCSAVQKAVANNDVIHFGVHSVLLPSDPAHSHLLLAPDAHSSGVLYITDLDRMALQSTRLVVLAGCDTATPVARRNVDTLALAFLAAGAPNVVGTLWKVDDEATRMFILLLHGALRHGATPAGALRSTQMAMSCSADPLLRRPSSWAGFQLYGRRE